MRTLLVNQGRDASCSNLSFSRGLTCLWSKLQCSTLQSGRSDRPGMMGEEEVGMAEHAME